MSPFSAASEVKILRNYALWATCGKDVQGKTRTVDEVLKDITSVSKHADSWLND